MTHRELWGLAAALAVIAAALVWLVRLGPLEPPPRPAPPGPAPEVLAKLTRGVNISGWLQHGSGRERREQAPTAADWQRLRAWGLHHARIPVDPAAFIGDRGLPDPAALQQLRETIDAALREDLLVVVALQLPSAAKQRLGAGEPARFALGGQWRALAAALRGVSPHRLVLEPLNEPELASTPARAVQQALVAELRQVLPHHTFVVAGHAYSGVDELEALQPLDDANVVYGFHFYEPHNFTHQGATWGDPAWRALRNFPYPSSPEAVAPYLAALPPQPRAYLRWHGEQRWDRGRIAQRLDQAAQWARRHAVPVWCSEFGVLRTRARPADRLAWLRDVREELEARAIGWSHWDYAGAFGLVRNGRVDERTAEALGLARR